MPYAESAAAAVYPNFFTSSVERSLKTSVDLFKGTCWYNVVVRESKQVATRRTTTAASNETATAGFKPPCFGAAATISGDGVSPAASAAASGSPPGNAAATCSVVAGRFAGSL